MTLRILALLFLAVPFAVTAGAAEPGQVAEPEAAVPALPVWQTLVYEEKAFWATARSELTLDRCPQTGDAWCLDASSSVANNRERISLSASPDGRLLERDRFSEGSNRRRKQWFFGLNRVTRERREQDTAGEWQITSRVEVEYPQGDKPVTDAMLLLALIEVSEATQTFVVNTDLNFYRITVTPAGEDLVEVAPGLGGVESRHRYTDLLNISAELIQPARDKPDFSLLGLSGELLIAFDRATGLPLQVRGRAPRLGYVALTLKSAELRDPPP